MTALLLAAMLNASDAPLLQTPAPDAAVDAEAVAKQRNETANSLMTAGFVLSGTSVGLTVAAGVFYGILSQMRIVCVTGPCPDNSQQQAWAVAGPLLIASAVAAAVGIPLLSRGIYLKRQRLD
jgi:hypothetical protein